jgi:hypothetical protein
MTRSREASSALEGKSNGSVFLTFVSELLKTGAEEVQLQPETAT